MPPPISSRSAWPSRLPITPSLSEGLAPPSTTTYGRCGSAVSLRSTSTSASTRSPAACGSIRGRSYTLACLRCIAPNPSPTYSGSPAAASPIAGAASAASLPASAARSRSSLLVSAGSKRTFSSRATSPSRRPAATAAADGPATSAANETGRPSSRARWPATGSSEGPPAARSAKSAPDGLPRCASTMTRAPRPASREIVGRLALTRPSSVIRVPSSGTLRSARSSTARPPTSSSSMPLIGCPVRCRRRRQLSREPTRRTASASRDE